MNMMIVTDCGIIHIFADSQLSVCVYVSSRETSDILAGIHPLYVIYAPYAPMVQRA